MVKLLLLTLSIHSHYLFAQMSNIEVRKFYKCYSIFLNDIPAANNTLLTQVSNGQKTAANACGELLDLASISAGASTPQTEEGRTILRSLLNLHRDFFQTKSYLNSLLDANQNVKIIDPQEPAYHWVYTLLSNQQPSHLVTTTNRYRAVRETGNSTYSVHGHSTLRYNRQIIGIEIDSPNNRVFNGVWGNSGRLDSLNHNMTRSFGAGILGSQAYILGNSGMYIDYSNANAVYPNGFKSMRRLSRAIFNDFLCKSLPAIRAEDIDQSILTQQATNKFSYAQSSACVRCHTTLEPGQAPFKNLLPTQTTQTGGDNVMFYAQYNNVSGTSPNFPITSDANYYKKQPTGQINYRSANGTLRQISVSNIEDLGVKLSLEPDFYSCIASHYYFALTGVQVNLNDLQINGSSTEPLSPQHLTHRNKVINLGNNLQNHKNLKTLITNIINDPSFLNP